MRSVNENTILRIVGVSCVTVAYAVAILQGHNGILLAGYTNTILIILFFSPKTIKKMVALYMDSDKVGRTELNNNP